MYIYIFNPPTIIKSTPLKSSRQPGLVSEIQIKLMWGNISMLKPDKAVADTHA